MRTLYDILGVSPDANKAVIKQAFRKLSKTFHPDNQETGDPETFKEIKKAWDVLGNDERRKKYDETGVTEESTDSREAAINHGVVMALGLMLRSYIESPMDLRRNDAVKEMRDQLGMKRGKLALNEKEAKRKFDRSCEMLQRMKQKNTEDNPISGILNKTKDELQRLWDESLDHLEIHRRMVLLLEAFDYDFEAATQKQEMRITFGPRMLGGGTRSIYDYD